MKRALLLLLSLAVPAASRADTTDLSLADAIGEALSSNPSVAAGSAQVAARQAQARASERAGLPTASLSAQAAATNDPLAAFGMKLQERNVAAADFAPDKLNSPGIVGSVSLGADAQVPLYAGGRLDAAKQSSAAQAAASEAEQGFRRQQLALGVVAAYFRAQLAAQGLAFAQDTLKDAQETERFALARVRQNLMLQSDASRASAFRAQAESEVVSATERLENARDDLVLLVGERARGAKLSTPVDAPVHEPTLAAARGDIEAARQQEAAARAQVDVARSAARPQVSLQLHAGTLWGGGSALGAFATAGVGGRWDFLAPSRGSETEAAERAAEAAAQMRRWSESQAQNEIEKSRRALNSARARVVAARDAVAAAETSRSLRQARHREGLLPLTDLLDAEAAVTSARTSLLEAQLAERVGHAQLALALGQPIEGVAR